MKMKEKTLLEAFVQPELGEFVDRLRDYESRPDKLLPATHWEHLSDLKNKAVAINDQVTAKAVWCLETIGRVQDHFVSVFLHIDTNKFQEAWNRLDSCENEIYLLDNHFKEVDGEFGIEHARRHTKQLQELYPYKWGVSPAMVYKEVRCSICDAKLTLRTGCEHRAGEIYDGKYCARRITGMELLHIALVDNPVQKFSVIFPNGNDDQQFTIIKYLGDALSSPWDRWSYDKEERRQHHPLFKGVGRNDPCPCGTTLKYKRCCLTKETVMPHFRFNLEKEPAGELQRIVFVSSVKETESR